jgi:hypothetical protein
MRYITIEEDEFKELEERARLSSDEKIKVIISRMDSSNKLYHVEGYNADDPFLPQHLKAIFEDQKRMIDRVLELKKLDQKYDSLTNNLWENENERLREKLRIQRAILLGIIGGLIASLAIIILS